MEGFFAASRRKLSTELQSRRVDPLWKCGRIRGSFPITRVYDIVIAFLSKCKMDFSESVFKGFGLLLPKKRLESALENASTLIRPPDDVFYKELDLRYGSVRRYLPTLLEHVAFDANPAGRPVVDACNWLRNNMHRTKSILDAPREVIGSAWQRSVVRENDSIDIRAYTFCTLERLATAIHRRDVFTKRSWHYVDPRTNLLSESEWKTMRPVVCRSLGWSPQPEPVLEALSNELDRTYREVAQRLSKNPDVLFETVNGKKVLILSPLEKLEEPALLVDLRATVAARLPRGCRVWTYQRS